MMGSDPVQIDGLSELLSALDQFPNRVSSLAVRGAIAAGCEVLAARAKELAPIAPPNTKNAQQYGAVAGSLRNSIKVLPVTVNNAWLNGVVKAGSGIAYYARWVEFGTAAHYIERGSKGLTDKGTGRGKAERKMHPGSQKKPFMRPAIDTAGPQAIQAFGDYLRRRIDDENLSGVSDAG